MGRMALLLRLRVLTSEIRCDSLSTLLMMSSGCSPATKIIIKRMNKWKNEYIKYGFWFWIPNSRRALVRAKPHTHVLWLRPRHQTCWAHLESWFCYIASRIQMLLHRILVNNIAICFIIHYKTISHFEEVGKNSFGVGFAKGNRILNIKFSLYIYKQYIYIIEHVVGVPCFSALDSTNLVWGMGPSVASCIIIIIIHLAVFN